MTKISVLLVDDSLPFLEAATRFLQQHGSITVVGTARGGKAAMPLAQELKPDVALVDLSMPDLPGLELIPLLHTALPEMHIVALTLLDTAAYQHAALEAGAEGFVSKKTMSATLVPAIMQLVQSDATVSPRQHHTGEE